jgi:magnesium-transporting ATPase (P-type)
LQVPFNSQSKFSVTAIQLPYGGFIRLLAKGAPEAILPLCKTYINSREGQDQLTQDAFSRIDTQRQVMAKEGLRTLAFAYADFVSETFDKFKLETNDLSDFSSA